MICSENQFPAFRDHAQDDIARSGGSSAQHDLPAAVAGPSASRSFPSVLKPAKPAARAALKPRRTIDRRQLMSLLEDLLEDSATQADTGSAASRAPAAQKVYVKSYGCQMNVYDAQRMADTLSAEGFVETGAPDDADLVILNTCHIREKAAEKVFSELGRLRQLKRAAAHDGRRMIIAVAGCVAQAEGAEIVRRAPVVDVVV